MTWINITYSRPNITKACYGCPGCCQEIMAKHTHHYTAENKDKEVDKEESQDIVNDILSNGGRVVAYRDHSSWM